MRKTVIKGYLRKNMTRVVSAKFWGGGGRPEIRTNMFYKLHSRDCYHTLNISDLHNNMEFVTSLFLPTVNFSSVFNKRLERKLTDLKKKPNSVPSAHGRHSQCLEFQLQGRQYPLLTHVQHATHIHVNII